MRTYSPRFRIDDTNSRCYIGFAKSFTIYSTTGFYGLISGTAGGIPPEYCYKFVTNNITNFPILKSIIYTDFNNYQSTKSYTYSQTHGTISGSYKTKSSTIKSTFRFISKRFSYGISTSLNLDYTVVTNQTIEPFEITKHYFAEIYNDKDNKNGLNVYPDDVRSILLNNLKPYNTSFMYTSSKFGINVSSYYSTKRLYTHQYTRCSHNTFVTSRQEYYEYFYRTTIESVFYNSKWVENRSGTIDNNSMVQFSSRWGKSVTFTRNINL